MSTYLVSDLGKLCYTKGEGEELVYKQPGSQGGKMIYRRWFTMPDAGRYEKYGRNWGYGVGFVDPAVLAPDAIADMEAYTWASVGSSNVGAQEHTYNYDAPVGDVVGPQVYEVISRAYLYRYDTSAVSSVYGFSNYVKLKLFINNPDGREFVIRFYATDTATPTSTWSTLTGWDLLYQGTGDGTIEVTPATQLWLVYDYVFFFVYMETYDHLGEASAGYWHNEVRIDDAHCTFWADPN
jgi:hypothetical protein